MFSRNQLNRHHPHYQLSPDVTSLYIIWNKILWFEMSNTQWPSKFWLGIHYFIVAFTSLRNIIKCCFPQLIVIFYLLIFSSLIAMSLLTRFKSFGCLFKINTTIWIFHKKKRGIFLEGKEGHAWVIFCSSS